MRACSARPFRVFERLEEAFQVEVQRRAQIARRVRVQAEDRLVHEVGVQEARRGEIRRGRVEHVVVHPADVAPGLDGMRSEDLVRALARDGVVRAEEALWETAVLEEAASDVQVELPVVVASVNEKIDGERGLAERGEVARRDEGEVGIGSDGLLDTLEAELAGDGEVVFPGAVAVAEVDELLRRNN